MICDCRVVIQMATLQLVLMFNLKTMEEYEKSIANYWIGLVCGWM